MSKQRPKLGWIVNVTYLDKVGALAWAWFIYSKRKRAHEVAQAHRGEPEVKRVYVSRIVREFKP